MSLLRAVPASFQCVPTCSALSSDVKSLSWIHKLGIVWARRQSTRHVRCLRSASGRKSHLAIKARTSLPGDTRNRPTKDGTRTDVHVLMRWLHCRNWLQLRALCLGGYVRYLSARSQRIRVRNLSLGSQGRLYSCKLSSCRS